MFPWIAQAANSLPKFLLARLLPQALVFDDFDKVQFSPCYREHT